jgi:hypothetical protein
LPNIGEWEKFSPVQIQKSSRVEIIKPQQQISIPTIPESSWNMSIPKNTGNYC